jgi:AcrR family transcriptional regulator
MGRAVRAYTEVRREQLVGLQRARILSAMSALAGERGAGRMTVADVVGRAGVSRRTFYEIFDDGEDCFLAAFNDALAQIAAVVVPAYRTGGPVSNGKGAAGGASGRVHARWHERVRRALVGLLGLFEEQPGLARMVVVESPAAGSSVMERRNRVLAHAIAAVDEGRLDAKRGAMPPPLTAEGVVGGVGGVIHARLLTHAPQDWRGLAGASHDRSGVTCARLDLLGLTNELMAMIVLPYLGPAAARRELARPAPTSTARAPVAGERDGGDPLRELGMRLTYRTVRVLDAVASHPGASNRQVGELAGVSDQGQISKLLARLRRIGLLSNAAGGVPVKGEPNRWSLTVEGERVARTILTHTSTPDEGESAVDDRGADR